MTDRELERFCAEAHATLVGALTHQFGDRWLAEELAQEALVRVCDHWGRVRGLASPVGWAFRVGTNLGRSRLRRRAAERRARQRHGPHRPSRAMQVLRETLDVPGGDKETADAP